MSSKKAIIALLAVGVLACAVAALIALRPAGGTAVATSVDASTRAAMSTPTYWQDKMVACANGVMTDGVLDSEPVQKCLLDVMKKGIDAGQMMTINHALEEQIKKTPVMFNACHNVGHKAGRYAFEKTHNAAQLLRDNKSDTCLYAMGHGILDGFAASSPTDQQFSEVAETCVELLRHRENKATLCADGLGHVAWSSTENIVDAVHRCDLISTDDGKAACGEGVIMQVFEPAGFLPSEDIAKAPEELPEMCDTWDTTSLMLKRGCNSGAAYIYTRPAWRVQVAWRTSHDPNVRLDKKAQDEILADMTQASKMCLQHKTELAVSQCQWGLSGQVPHLVYDEPALLEKVCSMQGEWKDRCLTWRHVLS